MLLCGVSGHVLYQALLVPLQLTSLTPYGVLALMTKVVAGSNLQDIIKLGSFVVVFEWLSDARN